MKKILIVNDLLTGGGVEKLLQDFVDRWHDKYDVTVMTIVKQANYREVLPDNVKYLYTSVARDYKSKFSIA